MTGSPVSFGRLAITNIAASTTCVTHSTTAPGRTLRVVVVAVLIAASKSCSGTTTLPPATRSPHPCRPRIHHGAATRNPLIGHDGRVNEVSAREAEVLEAVAAHRSNAQIAGALHI